MKRRDLLKSSILGLSASALVLSGCDKKEQSTINQSDEFDIIPKQTGIYEFSAPLLFNFEAIDKIVNYNKQFKKSQIKTLYNSIPWPQSEKFNEWFMLFRGRNPDLKTYSDFEKYVKYALDKGFDVVYLMNSPKAFNDRDIESFKKDFYKVLDNLWKTGIRKIKFANTQVAQLIYEYNPAFEFQVATIIEYSSVGQYQNLIHFFPNIKHICISKDQNQNFKLLTSLKKTFPDIKLELMIGEGCLKYCPSRSSCMASSLSGYYKIGCKLAHEDPGLVRTLTGTINPWDIEYYSAIGINNFKIIPFRQRAVDQDPWYLEDIMTIYEKGIADIENISNYLKTRYGISTQNPQEIISLFPKMEYFIKHGAECATTCRVECNYCYECAKKIENMLIYG